MLSYKELLIYLKHSFSITRAIDVNGLIGNIGGYIGLCLGYSILQIPEFVTVLFYKWNKRFSDYRMKNAVFDVSVDVRDKSGSIKMVNSYKQDNSKERILNDIRCLKKEVNDINIKLDDITRSMAVLLQRHSN